MKNFLAKSAFTIVMLGFVGAAHAAAYNEIEVTDGGTIVGSISAGEAAAESKTYTISKDPDICGEGTRTVEFVRVNEGMLQDAVVFLEKVKEGKPFPEEIMTLTLTQEACEFAPALGVIANLFG